MPTTIPAAHGPLPRVGTKAYGRFADRYENAGCHGFSREDDATVSAGWWARIHGLAGATLHCNASGRFVFWAS